MAEELTCDDMMGIIGSKQSRWSKYCSSHLLSRSKSFLIEGKKKLFEVGV